MTLAKTEKKKKKKKECTTGLVPSRLRVTRAAGAGGWWKGKGEEDSRFPPSYRTPRATKEG